MKKIDLYEIAIKILGLYLVVVAIGQLREVLLFATLLMQSNNDYPVNGISQMPIFLTTLFSFIILTLFAFFLIFKTKGIARFICQKGDLEDTLSVSSDKKSFYEIALTIVGLLTIVLTLPDFGFQLKSHVQLVQNNYNIDSQGFLMISGLKMIIGLFLLGFSKTISSYFGRTDNTNSFDSNV